ncbi:guanine nucleotide-exchange factor SEC12-like [Watersipora subatra]|uniref:guanine nucleotide-exchange factor SEC12-like n=1 Tax=Watersipora subatra TaxID=2589382 RepID=UPI00355B3627
MNRLLLNVDFPIFVIEFIGPKHFLVGGGGGPSATGVPNGLEIFELITTPGSSEVGAKSVCRFKSGTYAIMNCAKHADGPITYLACGHDDKCVVYSVKQKVITPRPNSPDGQVRKRKSGLTKADDFKNAKKVISFDVKQLDSVVTDFHTEDAYQSCSTFGSDGSHLLTAGADGCIRMWKYPDMVKVWETKAHEQEVDVLQINSSATQLCSTSKDGKLLLWDAKDGKALAELKWTSEPPIKYKHKACRYSMLDRDPQKESLFSIEVPVANKKGAPSYITQWSINRHKAMNVHPVYMGSLACMDISTCGRYLAVGSMEGDVAVFNSINLKQIYHVKGAHKTFVTGLAFSPNSAAGLLVTNHSQFSLVSISIDNQLKLHQPPQPSLWKSTCFLLVLLLLLSIIFAVFAMGFAEDVLN